MEIINKYNDFVIKSFTRFFTYICQTLKQKNPQFSKKLIFSQISFNSETKKPVLDNFFKKWTYETNLASPFAGLSGIKDTGVLKNNKYLFLNVIPELNIDNKVLPVFQNEQNLSNYALKFLLFEDTEFCIKILISKTYNHFIGDLLNYLKDFLVIFRNINQTFKTSAPINDPIRIIFEKMQSLLNYKYKKAIEIMVDSNENFMEE